MAQEFYLGSDGQTYYIEIGDFIQSEGLPYYGWVIGEGITGRNIPAWKVDKGGGEPGVIFKSQALLLHKAIDPLEELWEQQQEVTDAKIVNAPMYRAVA